MACTCLLTACVFEALMGCGPSMQTLGSLASSGRIDPVAPVIAHTQTDIAAPREKVWALLVNAPQWPRWYDGVSFVRTAGPLSPKQTFTWGEGSTTVLSQVQLFENGRRLGWTGKVYTAKAVHLWTLTSEPGSHTRVTIDESIDGPLMAEFFSSQKLIEAGNNWLAQLKKAAECAQ